MKLENFKNGYDVTLGSSLAKNETNDCAVRAFANAFNITYDTAHQFAADKFERKARKGFAFAADDLEMQKFELRFEFEETPDQMQVIKAMKWIVKQMMT